MIIEKGSYKLCLETGYGRIGVYIGLGSTGHGVYLTPAEAEALGTALVAVAKERLSEVVDK